MEVPSKVQGQNMETLEEHQRGTDGRTCTHVPPLAMPLTRSNKARAQNVLKLVIG